MNENRPPDISPVPDPDADVDPGEPIRELAELEDAPPADFLTTVVRKIERRLLGVNVLEFTRNSFWELCREYWDLIMSMVKGEDRQNGGRKE
jgi:hypothetical protein